MLSAHRSALLSPVHATFSLTSQLQGWSCSFLVSGRAKLIFTSNLKLEHAL